MSLSLLQRDANSLRGSKEKERSSQIPNIIREREVANTPSNGYYHQNLLNSQYRAGVFPQVDVLAHEIQTTREVSHPVCILHLEALI